MKERTDDTLPMTPQRRDRIRKELARRGRGAHAKLAEAIDVSTGQLTGILSESSKYSSYIGRIYGYFGWELASESETEIPHRTPVDPNSAQEIVRLNMIRFREEAKHSQFSAADAAGIAYEDLLRYEQGDADPPNAVIMTLAPIYFRRPGDFMEKEPPAADLANAPLLWWRGHPDVVRKITEEDRRRLDQILSELSDKYRTNKKAVVAHVRKAAQRRQPTK